jgi:hypothetical protein
LAQYKDGSQTIVLDLPLQSQRATVSQRIGLTDINVVYHRPLAKGREVMGKLVPYGEVWRAGANENTTIEFTDPVMIEGKPLPKGIYGLHMIPGEQEWTIIFSSNSTSWGSFTYDEKEDVLRVAVKPQPSGMHDALIYEFDELEPNSAALTMRWEKLAVPVKISVNVVEITQESLRKQLRTLAQYNWMGWHDAAKYLLEENLSLEDALKYADRSIADEERYDNLLLKAQVLTALKRDGEAAPVLAKAMEKANAGQSYFFARGIMFGGEPKKAAEQFRANFKKHPNEWLSHLGMARAYSSEGDFTKAVQEIDAALKLAPEQQKQGLQQQRKRLEAKSDINKN